MRCTLLRTLWLAWIGLSLAPGAPARAVIVRDPRDAGAPTAVASRFAVVAGFSGAYLGDGWILTARHVLAAARREKRLDVRLDGATYPLVLESAVELSAGGAKADLAMVRIDGHPEATALPIVKETPPVGTRVTMIGNGPLQEASRTCWDAAGQEAPAGTPGARCGYRWRKEPDGKTNGVQWGTNQVAAIDGLLPGPAGTRTRVFSTRFRDAGATPREAQAGVGDSGGPVFVQRGGQLVLAGILLGVSSRASNATLFGDQSFAADLSAYRNEIQRVVGGR